MSHLFYCSIQYHLSKCFDGIDKVEFAENFDITHMKSKEGEIVELKEKLSTEKARGQIERWLFELENVMFATVRKIMTDAMADYEKNRRIVWVRSWMGQAVLAVSMFHWAQNVHRSIAEGQKVKFKKQKSARESI